MNQINSIPDDFSQNDQLPIRIVSPDFGHLPPEAVGAYGLTHRLSYYFLHFTLEGTSHQGIDTNEFEIERHELLFSLPNQVRQVSATVHGGDYYKLGFDESCLSKLPRQYPFY